MADPRDLAVAFRRRLAEADDLFADAVDRVMRGLRGRRPGVEPAALARHLWVTEIPSFGSLAGPAVDLRRGALTLSETRAGAGRYALPVWSRGPDDDPLAERDAAVALVAPRLVVTRRAIRFGMPLVALVDVAAVAGWFGAYGRAAGGGSIEAALLADLGALASDLCGPSGTGGHLRPGPIESAAPAGGIWRGEVVAAPNRPPSLGDPAGRPTGIVAMVATFDA